LLDDVRAFERRKICEGGAMIRVLTHATLIDGTGAAPLPDAVVVIDADRITAAGPRPSISWPPDAEIIDARGRTLIPGLIDAHDHLASHSYGLATRWGLDEPASTAHLRTARVLAETLAMGYTTVRDGGGLDAGFKLAVEQGLIPGPRLVLGIQIISPTGGIGDRVSPSGHGCCAAYDPLLPDSVANGPDAVRDVVRTMVRAGADVIKTATTGGASSRPGHGPLDGAFTLPEMEALVAESHALGRRVMCHALGGPGLRVALEAGVDSIEHGCYLDEDATLLAQMAVQGTVFVPTLTVYVYHRESPAPHVRERAVALYPHHVASVRRALDLGVPIAAGTDAGGHGHPKNALELKYLVEAGLTPMQALRAATQWAARCLGLEREVGTIEKGRLADIVVVNGNPLDDVTMLLDPARIELVLKGGAICVDRRSPSPR
jgi:imidazolonepropionase-like amidohydrolase